MRIVVDMQSAQTESRFRGIGRYTSSFAQAIARNRGEHEVFLALSGLFPDSIESIRAAFDGLLPQENIRVWHAPGPVEEKNPMNDARREVAELMREAFLTSLAPDVVHINSLFEGYADNAVTSIGRFDRATPVSVSLYDLIPLLNPEHYLKPNPRYARYYQRKIEHLKKAATLLSISEFTRQEGMAHLCDPAIRIVNVATAIEPCFCPRQIDNATAAQLRQKFRLNRPFILYTGGADERKNLPRLIQAYAALPAPMRGDHQLLLAGMMPEGNIAQLKSVAKAAGLKADALHFTGYVTDEELIQLYNLCKLFVFPSWHEGFGLPALEAMACGAPVIGANSSSLPEVIGLEVALFDPLDVKAIAAKMEHALEDQSFRSKLRDHGLQQAQRFCWDDSAKRAIAAWESLPGNRDGRNSYSARSLCGTRLIQELTKYHHDPASAELISLAACIAQNQSVGIERQLLLDISELCQRDAATGVQGVVRGYLTWLLQSPPAGFRVEPVYATLHQGYRYARRFTQRFLGQDDEPLTDDPLRWQRGDIFFGLDMQHQVQLAHQPFYRQLRREGVTVKFLVHDLLHEQWLTMVAATDGAICISRATADAFGAWMAQNTVTQAPNFHTDWVPVGGDLDGSKPSQGLPPEAPGTVPWSTWQQSAENLKSALVGQHYPRRQLLVDISELIHHDAKTGIQRVVRSVLSEWLLNPPSGWLVEPVYATVNKPYRYAKLFTARFLKLPTEGLIDYPMDYSPGDVFLGLDLAPAVIPAHESFYQKLRQVGVLVKFVVYDLLPLMPSYFEQAHAEAFSRWLHVAVASDGAICISRSVADDLGLWLNRHPTLQKRSFIIDWFHLGAEIDVTMPTKGFPTEAVYVLDRLRNLPSFLMVSTLSPHKGHAQVLDAFEYLWHTGVVANLVIVGKQGGQVEDLAARLRTHSELNKRLFWLEGISDEYLQKVYAASTCLIAASHGEGFGLPLIEAAQHKLPIIARDIPVFREVAGAHAWYFNACKGTDLANSVTDWLACHEAKQVPLSENISFLTWQQSAQRLMQLCIGAYRNTPQLTHSMESSNLDE